MTDNNESFSSLVHAANLFDFGLAGSKGLTDEAYGPNPDAHPYVYSHQGNFPRLFAFLIYVLGARSIQSQIVITTFTIGLVGVFLLYEFFSRRATPFFGLVVALIFLTDYMLFAEWQVVTYRVWHAMLLFGALVCVEHLGRSRRRRWFALTVATYAALYYFDLVFVAFVALLTALFAAYLYRTQLTVLLKVYVAHGVGAMIGLGVLLAQLVAYLGIDGLKEDIRLTYLARNGSAQSDPLVDALHQFYGSHNIVFWYNLVDTGGFRTPGALLSMLFTWGFQVDTPLLTLIALVLIAAWVVDSLVVRPAWQRRGWRGSKAFGGLPTHLRALISLVGPAIATYLLVLAVANGQTYAGAGSSKGIFPQDDERANLIAIAAAGACVAVVWFGAGANRLGQHVGRLLAAAAYVTSAALFIRVQPNLYNQDWQILWLGQLESQFPAAVEQLMVLIGVGTGAAVIVAGGRCAFPSGIQRALNGAFPYLACAIVAYVVTFLLSPGYVFSGYLQRAVPLVVFFLDVILAFGAVMLIGVVRAWLPPLSHGPHVRALASLGAAAGFGLLLFGGTYWLFLQQAYIRLIPPNNGSFLLELSSPSFVGQTFVVNNYAAPIAAMTGQWAYNDSRIQNGEVQLTNSGYLIQRDMDTYMWLADKRTNAEYLKPAYFACFAHQDLPTLVGRLTNPPARGFCPPLGILNRPAGASDWWPAQDIVASDPDPLGRWAIVRLDWNYPPFLEAQADGQFVRTQADVDASGGGVALRPVYTARQQDGVPLTSPTIRLYAADETSAAPGCVLADTREPAGFVLPADFRAFIYISVQPATAGAVGKEYFSERRSIGVVRFTIPNTRTGGAQQILAATLDEAQQRAAAAGTWTPEAGNGLKSFTLPDTISGYAQQVEARSVEEAKQLAQAAGSWNPAAGTLGKFTEGPVTAITDLAGLTCQAP